MPRKKVEYSKDSFAENLLRINFNDKIMQDSKKNALTSLKQIFDKLRTITPSKYNQMLSDNKQSKAPIFGQILSNLQNSRIMVRDI